MATRISSKNKSVPFFAKARLVLLLGLVASTAVLLSGWFGAPPSDADAARITKRAQSESGGEVVELLSAPHVLDRAFRSMEGPSSLQRGITLLPGKHPELLWLTGVHATVIPEGEEKSPAPQFFCHANLMLDRDGSAPGLGSRMLTLVPGRSGISLPAGYGVPVLSNQPLDFYSMALNRNPSAEKRRVRFRTRIEFTRDVNLGTAIQPLVLRALYVTEPIGDPQSVRAGSAHDGEGGCGEHAGVSASKGGILERFGADRTIHWMAPPGRHEYRVPVNDQLELSSDTTLLYATAHLHPFGRFVSLRDLTADRTVLTVRQTESADAAAGPAMEEVSIREGVPLSHDHRYELTAVYENDTSEPVDAMAILYLYVLDKDFRRPV